MGTLIKCTRNCQDPTTNNKIWRQVFLTLLNILSSTSSTDLIHSVCLFTNNGHILYGICKFLLQKYFLYFWFWGLSMKVVSWTILPFNFSMLYFYKHILFSSGSSHFWKYDFVLHINGKWLSFLPITFIFAM